MNTNLEILEALKEAYTKLNSEPSPKFKTKDVIKNSRIVLNSEWDSMTNDRIGLIIVADNPGKKEEEFNTYLHPNGPTGKLAREFIDQYEKIDEQKEQKLILNKTPFWSNRSSTLENNNIIKKSVKHTIKALYKLWNINLNVNILVLGYTKGYCMNTYFFEFLNLCKDENFKKSIFFAHHPSQNNLAHQVASSALTEYTSKKKITIEGLLKGFNDLNRRKIEDIYGLKIN